MALAFGGLESVAIELIDDGDDGQPRMETDSETVAGYARDLEAGDEFPPVLLVKVDTDCYRIADGHHRVGAHKKAGRETVAAQVASGTAEQALLFGAVEANRKSAKNPTRADRRRYAGIVLRSNEHREASDREVARLVGLSHPTIARIRLGCGAKPTVAGPERLVAGKNYRFEYDDGGHGFAFDYGWHRAEREGEPGYWMIALETWLEGPDFAGEYRKSVYGMDPNMQRGDDTAPPPSPFGKYRLIGWTDYLSKGDGGGLANWEFFRKYQTHRAQLDIAKKCG